MPSRVKELTVKETVERYSSVGAFIAVDYPGVSAEGAAAFRKDLREKNVDFRVLKNNLAKVAFKELGCERLGDMIGGRLAIVAAEDAVEASKAAAELAKELKFKVKGGWGEGKLLSTDDIKKLAAIPSRKALFAQIAGLATAPLRALVGMIGAPGASLARAMQAWNEKRGAGESDGSAAGEA